jgi:hypothetical protein
MLVAQAAAQFAWWTGRQADTNAMRAAAAQALARAGGARRAAAVEAGAISGSTAR